MLYMPDILYALLNSTIYMVDSYLHIQLIYSAAHTFMAVGRTLSPYSHGASDAYLRCTHAMRKVST